MKKINAVIYNKLLAQAEEAKSQGLGSLASSILEALGPYPDEEKATYSYSSLKEDIHRDLWKMATRLMYYYDVQSLDAEKLDETIVEWADKVVTAMEDTMRVNDVVVGPLEPSVPGQNK